MYNEIIGNRFYFGVFIDGLVTNTKGIIEAKLTNTNNLSPNKTQNIRTTYSDYLGLTSYKKPISYNSKDGQLYVNLGGTAENKIESELNNIKLGSNTKGNYIEGEISITRTINGVKSNPIETPEITLEIQGGNNVKVYTNKSSGNKYYFGVYTDGYVLGKSATLKIETSKMDTRVKTKGKEFLGLTTYNKPISYSSDSGNLSIKLGGEYSGSIKTIITSLALGNNSKGNYIYGEILINEEIEGKIFSTSTLPKISLKTAKGNSIKTTVKRISTDKYYFEVPINNIINEKSLSIEAELTNEYNISKNNKQSIKTNNTKALGKTTDNIDVSYTNNQGELLIKIGK